MAVKYVKFLFVLILVCSLLVTGCEWSRNRVKDIKGAFGGNDFDPEVEKRKSQSATQAASQKNPLLKDGNTMVASNQTPASGPSEAIPYQYNYKKAFEKMAQKITELFPPLEGLVVSKENDKVLLNFSAPAGLKEGMLMPIIRKGEVFKHPLTGQPLGKLEKVIGSVEVQEIMPDYSTGRILNINQGEEVKAGDVVRIPGYIRLAVFPTINQTKQDIENNTLLVGLVEPLKKTNRFRIYDEDKLKAMILGEREGLEKLEPAGYLDKFQKKVPVDYFVISAVKELKGEKLIEGQLISISQKKIINEFNAFVDKESQVMTAAIGPTLQGQGGQIQGANKKPVFIRSNAQKEDLTVTKIDFPVRKMASGDVTGDGKSKLVMVSDKQLRVALWQNDKLVDVYTMRGEETDNFLYVDVADINKNGVPEIYVANLAKDRPRSFVIEFINGRFQKIKENIGMFLHVINIPGKDPILAAQAMGYDRFFDGPVYRYAWQDGNLNKAGSIELPKNINLYDFTLADIKGDGVEAVLAIAGNNHLKVYSKDTDWESNDYYGGYINEIKYKTVPDAQIRYDTLQDATGQIKGRIYVGDLSGDGKLEVIAPRKIIKGGFAYTGIGSHSEYEISNLTWDGHALIESWKTTARSGDLVDFQFVDLDGDGVMEIVVSTANIGKVLDRREDFLLIYKYRL